MLIGIIYKVECIQRILFSSVGSKIYGIYSQNISLQLYIFAQTSVSRANYIGKWLGFIFILLMLLTGATYCLQII